jgi:hypothetical protein
MVSVHHRMPVSPVAGTPASVALGRPILARIGSPVRFRRGLHQQGNRHARELLGASARDRGIVRGHGRSLMRTVRDLLLARRSGGRHVGQPRSPNC